MAEIFPSSAFGADYIRALKAVLPPEVPVLAVGGVTPESLATWIQAGCAGAGLGSDLYRAGQAVERTREQAERFISASKSSVPSGCQSTPPRWLSSASLIRRNLPFAWGLLAIASSVASTSTIASIA